MTEKRVRFDFEVEFSNGGGIQGQDFRLDIDGDDIEDAELAAYIIKDLRLLMVGRVNILNKSVIVERHKRAASAGIETPPNGQVRRYVDLSHTICDGMITYKGLPAPHICDYLSREASRGLYAPGTEFQIGRIDMVSNTGTYIDAPFHRFADGHDLDGLPLERVSHVPGVVVRTLGAAERAIDWTAFAATEVRGRAVLINTGWDRHFGTDAYFEGHPFLTEAAAEWLKAQGAAVVGIDSFNIDDVSGGTRPVHTVLLGAGIPIVEHMTRLDALPNEGFAFTAAPPRIAGMGTFPVRAHALLD